MEYGWAESAPEDALESEPEAETLGALLARVRDDQGISQLRLAARLCAAAGCATVTRHEVSRWEREERIPTGYWLSWLAVVLDRPLPELERAAGAARRRRDERSRLSYLMPAPWVQCAPGVFRRAS